jgi:hypothetical protein
LLAPQHPRQRLAHQYFGFDVHKWLKEHGADPMKPGARQMRNSEWFHIINNHIISMPDKWEYPYRKHPA